jgi:hypothetical protein
VKAVSANGTAWRVVFTWLGIKPGLKSEKNTAFRIAPPAQAAYSTWTPLSIESFGIPSIGS